VKAIGSAGKLVQLAEAKPRTFEEDLALMFPINLEHPMDVGGSAETHHDAEMHFDASKDLISIFRDACPLETDEKPPSDKQKAFLRFQMKASTAHINMVRTSREASAIIGDWLERNKAFRETRNKARLASAARRN
jgi:hypothetical protein